MGKFLQDSEGNIGGIQAGSPFTIDYATFVQEVAPVPLINTWRLGRIRDASQSIIAYGVNSGAAGHALVLGENVVDSAVGHRAVLLGYNLQQNAPAVALAADDQVIIGNNIAIPLTATDAIGSVFIGSSFTFTGFVGVANTFGNNVGIGRNVKFICQNLALGDANNNVVIGANAQAVAGGGVAIGSSAQTSDSEATALGQLSVAAVQCVAVGSRATASDHSVSVGRSAQSGSSGIAIGSGASALGGTNSMAFGRNATTSTANGSILFGRDASLIAGQDNLAMFGSATVPINEMRFGNGHNLNSAGRTYTLTVTDRDTTNNATGNTLLVRAGLGTGTWANAENLGLGLQVGLAVGAGNAQQTATTVVAIRHADTNVALWGGFGAAFGGGTRALYLSNATVNPAGAIAGGGLFYVTGGKIHWLSSAGVDTDLTAGGGGGTITGGGTAGFLSRFSGASAIGNSAIAQVAGATLQNISIGGGLATTFVGVDGGLFLADAAARIAAPVAAPTGGTIFYSSPADEALMVLSTNGDQIAIGDQAIIGYDANYNSQAVIRWLFDTFPSVLAEVHVGGGSTLKFVKLENANNGVYWDAGNGWTNAPSSVLYPDDPTAADIGGNDGITDFYWRDIYIHGQIWQDGTDGAGVGVGTLATAPHAGNPDAWVPYNFNGVNGWLPWWHA